MLDLLNSIIQVFVEYINKYITWKPKEKVVPKVEVKLSGFVKRKEKWQEKK